MLHSLFRSSKPVIGMVHLRPLPGSPSWQGSLQRVLGQAREDAESLVSGGVNGIIIENFGDTPLHKCMVGPHTVAAMTRAVIEIQRIADVPLGVNVLRNDAMSALAIAAATGARFIRVNVHTGAMVADEGLIEGQAAETLRYRRNLEVDIKIFADVLVKHASPLANQELSDAARTARERGLADALIVSGSRTGEATLLEDVVAVREAVPDVPVLVGSGISETNLRELLQTADGAIVGTNLKKDGNVLNPVDPGRVRRLVQLAQGLGR